VNREKVMSNRSEKRRHGGPTGNTPGKPKAKTSRGNESTGSSRKSLFNFAPPETAKKAADWSREEIVALIQYVALYTEEKKWPTTKQSDFWEACATAISENTGKAVRSGEY